MISHSPMGGVVRVVVVGRVRVRVLVLVCCFCWGVLEVGGVLECERQRVTGRPLFSRDFWNRSISCPSSFSWEWSTSRLCCYEQFDRFLDHPFCCYSEMYKLVVAVGFICLFCLGSSFLLCTCWFYNLPHHILYLLTCRRFHLNEWMLKSRAGPSYVDPSFYLKEPFWSRGGATSGEETYPLRPMPPRIFYPVPPSSHMKMRWELGGGEVPLFVLASRQFQRQPFSARPNERTPPAPNTTLHHHHVGVGPGESRRSSVEQLDSERNYSSGGVCGSGSMSGSLTLEEEEAEIDLREVGKQIDEEPIFMTTASARGGHEEEEVEEEGLRRSVSCGGGRYGSTKVSLNLMNQQLSTGLTLSINNLPQLTVVGNFGGGQGGGMETIEEDEDFGEGVGSINLEELEDSPCSSLPPPSDNQQPSQQQHCSAVERIVARQEVPFRPDLPGTIPEQSWEEATTVGRGNGVKISRRNSAPVNF